MKIVDKYLKFNSSIFTVGGLFTFPTNLLTKNQKRINGNLKKNPLIPKSSRPMYNPNRKINKALYGLLFSKPLDIKASDMNFAQTDIDFTSTDMPIHVDLYSDLRKFKNYEDIVLEVTAKQLTPAKTEDFSKYVGFNGFNKAYDEVILEMPEAAKYRDLLTKIARHESGFNMSVLNKSGAPAYGYFLFWQDGKINNVTAFSGLSLEEFRKNPKELIKAAVKMALKVERTFTKSDIQKALDMGISMSGMIGGAWLGGVGGVRKVLNGTGNPSDNHWNKNGKGSNVADCMQRYNNL